MTLLGPTVVDPEQLEVVGDHLTAVGKEHAPFTVLLRGTGTFRPVSAVVFVQVVKGIAECEQLERAVSASTRSASDVAREYDVSWWSVNHALVVKAAGMTPQAPTGVRMLGVDETLARSV